VSPPYFASVYPLLTLIYKGKIVQDFEYNMDNNRPNPRGGGDHPVPYHGPMAPPVVPTYGDRASQIVNAMDASHGYAVQRAGGKHKNIQRSKTPAGLSGPSGGKAHSQLHFEVTQSDAQAK
jgi:hypothetical protein